MEILVQRRVVYCPGTVWQRCDLTSPRAPRKNWRRVLTFLDALAEELCLRCTRNNKLYDTRLLVVALVRQKDYLLQDTCYQDVNARIIVM